MIESFQISSEYLKEKRKIRVFQPEPCTGEGKRYPVLYMHDGQYVFGEEGTNGSQSLKLKEYLEKSGLQIIVAAIDGKEDKERINDLCPWENGVYSAKITGSRSTLGGGGKDYAEFVVKELKPWIDANYPTSPEDSAVAGISLGGLISCYIMCCYPQVFKKAGGVSSAFFRNQEEIENLILNASLQNIEAFYLDCGTTEAGNDMAISDEFLASNKKVYRLMNEKVSSSNFRIIPNGAHTYEDFKERAPDMLTFLFSNLAK